jgi:hypothetical protein
VIDPPRAEELEEPQPEAQNPLPSREEASTSRQGALIASLREGLLACPLEALLEILPEESSSMSRTESSGENKLHEVKITFYTYYYYFYTPIFFCRA